MRLTNAIWALDFIHIKLSTLAGCLIYFDKYAYARNTEILHVHICKMGIVNNK